MRVKTLVSGLLLMLCQGSVWADESPSPQRYTLKQEEPSLGTHIKRDLVTGSMVPFDKRYSELTPEQQDFLKSQYEHMGPRDEPPFPVNGLLGIAKAIAAGQQRLGVEGPLTLFVDVDSTGQATAVSVIQSPDPDMTRFAASVLMLEKYKPARCDGTPCAMQFPYRTVFTLRR